MVRLKPAEPADLPALLSMARAFNDEDGHAFTPKTEAAIERLIATPQWGTIFMIEDGGEPLGYAVVCPGYSLEFGGPDAMLDEIFVAPDARGRGVASAAIRAIEAVLAARGIGALHAEVMDDNPDAARLYRRLGFAFRPSRYCAKRLGPDTAQDGAP